DNDGDLDLAVSGMSADNNLTKLYRNNGDGTLSEAPGVYLPGLDYSSVAWGDYDGDGYQDLALCGANYFYDYTYVYHNNGDGTFSQNYSNLVGVSNGSVAWGDVDNDGRLDLAVTGKASGVGGSTRIYRCQPDGSFLDTRLFIEAAQNSVLAWGDYDSDGKLDLAISGVDSYGDRHFTQIYRNMFWAANTPPSAPTGLSITSNELNLTFAWNASTDAQSPASVLTYNLKVGTSPGSDNIFSGMANATTGFRRLPKVGNAGNRLSWTLKGLRPGTYYASVQAIDTTFAGSPWSEQQSATVSGVSIRGSVLLANGNPVPGVVVTPSAGGAQSVTSTSGVYQVWVPLGWSGTITPSASMMTFNPASISYTNVTSDKTRQNFIAYPKLKISGHVRTYDGNGVYGVVVSATGMDDFRTSSDGYYEFVLPQGWSGTVKATNNRYAFAPLDRTYTNLTSDQPDQDFTSGRFVEVSTGIAAGNRAAWGDYNADGKLDVVVAGNGICKVYRNDGNDVFTEVASLIGIYNGAVAWGDYDGDGDLDLALTGGTIDGYQSDPVSRIYRNDAGAFVDADAGLPGYSYSAVAWADVDNDGDLDLAFSGLTDRDVPETKLFRNNAGYFVPMTTQLPAVLHSSLAWGDYDNDSDMDLAIMGRTDMLGPVTTKLFRNDMGTLNDSGVSLQGACNGTLAWGDVDNDGDIDLLVNGTVPGIPEYINTAAGALYINQGGGSFTETSLSIQDSMASFGDYDADGDIDLVMFGRQMDYSLTYYLVASLLQNNDAVFDNVTVDIQPMYSGSAAWGDYDNDGDLDLLIAGRTDTGFATRIYNNVGWAANNAPSAPTSLASSVSGVNLTLMWNVGSDSRTASTGLSYNLRVGTAPGKNDVFSGMATASGTRLIPSMGNAQKRLSWVLRGLKAGTYYWSVQSVDASLAASSWATERTVTITGRSISGRVATLDGSGVAGVLVSASNAGSAVTDAQGYYDLTVQTGWSGTVTLSRAPWYFNPTSRSYTSVTSNLTNQDFSAGMIVNSGMELTGIYSGDCAWGDYDNDGDLDLVAFGVLASDHTTGSKLYRNNAGVLVDSDISLPGFTYGACAWGDYDEDGDLDLAVTGLISDISDPVAITKIYSNNSGVLVETASLDGVYFSSLAWGDYDNDGDLDLAVSGLPAGSNDAITRIYRNMNGSFTDIGTSIPGVCVGCIAWADSDNDGDLDLALIGHTGSTQIGKIYRNDAGVFSDSGAYIKPLMYSALVWGDYDNDGDLDLATTGVTSGYVPETHIYRNDNGNIFFDVSQTLPGVSDGDIEWVDFDSDGDLDLVVSGENYTLGTITTVLRNDAGVFSDAQLMLPGLYNASIASADYDNDGDIDLVMTGTTQLSPSINPVLKVYNNTGAEVNTAPSAPTDLFAEKTGSQVLFTWQPSMDNETPSLGLSYNLRVGTAPGASDVFSGMSSADGFRKLPAIGNAQKQLSWIVKGVPKGTLYWSVQAIDASHKGSAWAAEQHVGPLPDTTSPVVTLDSITPPMVRAGDKLNVSVTATDNVGVVSVTANEVPMVRGFGNIWTGTIEADVELGDHKVKIEAADAAGNIGTTGGDYKTAQVVMTSCKSVADDIMLYAHMEWLFCLAGRVEVENENVFLVNDGSGSIRVIKSKHGLQNGDFVAVRGMLYCDRTNRFMQWPLEITVF
ncbi:MAG TPA: FG-GAP-like repeat-containing protein, partial [Armatimonadota bacterium]|nr:FG-GAP-like repeat-containing protein [Armatimonadota bacterium]